MTTARVHPSWKRSGSRYEQPYGFQEELYAKISVPPGERGLFLVASYVGFKYTGAQKKTTEDFARLFKQAWIQVSSRSPLTLLP